MSKNVDLKLMKQMSKEKFYDIDTLKKDYGFKTDEVTGRKTTVTCHYNGRMWRTNSSVFKSITQR